MHPDAKDFDVARTDQWGIVVKTVLHSNKLMIIDGCFVFDHL